MKIILTIMCLLVSILGEKECSSLIIASKSIRHVNHEIVIIKPKSALKASTISLETNDYNSNNNIPVLNKKELDKKIIRLAGPAILNFMIIPLVGAVDTYWVGRMSNALALAGQGAANQVFTSAFWIISFLPNVVTPLVAEAAGAGDRKAVQDRIGEALFMGLLMGAVGTLLLTLCTDSVLSIVLPTAGAVKSAYAHPYLRIRGITFIPALVTTIGT